MSVELSEELLNETGMAQEQESDFYSVIESLFMGTGLNLLGAVEDVINTNTMTITLDSELLQNVVDESLQYYNDVADKYTAMAKLADELGTQGFTTLQSFLDEAAFAARESADKYAQLIAEGIVSAESIGESLQNNLTKTLGSITSVGGDLLGGYFAGQVIFSSLGDIFSSYNENDSFAALTGTLVGLVYGEVLLASTVIAGAGAAEVLFLAAIATGAGMAAESLLRELNAYDNVVDWGADFLTFLDPNTRDLYFEQDSPIIATIGSFLDSLQGDNGPVALLGEFLGWVTSIGEGSEEIEEPEEPTPTPTIVISPTPTPEVTPTPITPTPVEVTPTPVEVTPTPVEVTPTPVEVTPTPVEVRCLSN